MATPRTAAAITARAISETANAAGAGGPDGVGWFVL
jgi:hypothetical protein